MKPTGLLIASVDDSIVLRKGLRPGDRILEIDGNPVQDELDWRFHATDSPVEAAILDERLGNIRLVDLEVEEFRGISFPPMRTQRCRNRCLFCFVDQLPAGLRETLYVKDEDYRCSFLYGNYVTLASVRDEELERIGRMRLGPLYVSVHATDPGVRNLLLGRKRSRDILEILEHLAGLGITMHTQVVLCPGVNDGEVLAQTIEDLSRLRPELASIAVVPVGLTRFRSRNGLFPLRAVGRKDAIEVVGLLERMKSRLPDRLAEPFLFLADEFYSKAGLPFPSIRAYGDLPQLENGVGMVALFNEQCREARGRRRRKKSGMTSPRRFIAVTGELAYPIVLSYFRWLEEMTGIPLTLIPVRNNFFGRRVNVAGLLAGRDVVRQLGGHTRPGDMVFVPEVMLGEGGNRFLDDLTLGDMEDTLNVRAVGFQANPRGFEKTLGV